MENILKYEEIQSRQHSRAFIEKHWNLTNQEIVKIYNAEMKKQLRTGGIYWNYTSIEIRFWNNCGCWQRKCAKCRELLWAYLS